MTNAKFKQLAVAAALAIGAVAPALAVPQFTIDPSVIPGNMTANTPFDATFISGISSELLTLSGNNASGSGFLRFTSFSNGVDTVFADVSGVGSSNNYGLYLTFSLAAALASGSPGAPGSVYNLTALTFTVFADVNQNTTFTPASSAGAGTQASVGGTTTDDIQLAAGSLLGGTAGFNAQGGVFLNSVQNFAVCTGPNTGTVGGVPVAVPGCLNNTGSRYFAAPIPFYSLAFDEFNNTSQGITRNGNLVAVQSASGGVDFNRVPEPATLALVGVALLGLGLSQRKRKSV